MRRWGTGWRPVTVLAALVALLAVIGAGLAQLHTDTTAASFLPKGDPAIHGLDAAASSFGGDPIVVLAESAKPRTLLGPDQLPRLAALEGELAGLPDVAVVYGPGTVLNQLAGSTQNLLATVAGRRDALRGTTAQRARAEGLSESAVQERVSRAVAEYDERYAALLVRGLPAGLPTLHNPNFAEAVVFGDQDQEAAPRPQWQFVVPAPDAVAVMIRPRQDLDQAGTERLVTAVRDAVARAGLDTTKVTVSGTPVVAAELSTTAQREIPVIGALALALIVTCYLVVPWTRHRRHRLVPPLVTLLATAVVLGALGWLGLPVSLGVIAFLPILIGIGSDFPAYVVRGANQRRVVAAGLASACGFASLALSPMPFVRDLGLALAAGVLVALTLILVLRRYLAPEPVAVRDGTAAPGHDASSDRESPTGTAGAAPKPDRMRPRPARSRYALLAAAVIVAALGWTALPHLDTAARPDRLAAGLPALDDAAHAERIIGSSGEVQVLLSGPDIATPEALDWMRRAQQGIVLDHGSELRPIVSVPDLLQFLGPAPSPAELASAMKLLPDHLRGAVIRPDHAQAVISLGIGLQDVDRQGELLDEVRAQLPPPPEGLSAEVVGLPVAAARGVELLSEGRYLGDVVGIAGAGLILLVGLRRRSDALRAVFAATLTTGWSLAMAWLLGITLSPLTVALGSLATATACEFTVLAGERRNRRAVAVAASAAALGYLALAASDIAMLRDFGLLLAATVLLSLAAAHAVLRLLPPRKTRPGGTATDENETHTQDEEQSTASSGSPASGSMEVRA